MNSKIYLAAACALALTACTNEPEPSVPADGAVAAQVVAQIDGVQTRASGTEWGADDEIGIYASPVEEGGRTNYSNVLYTNSANGFTSTSPIYFQDTETVTFKAYYPYTQNHGTVTAKTDAKAQADQPAIDFLFASGATASKASPTVNFTNNGAGADCSFHHKMCQVSLKLFEGDDIDFNNVLTGYTLTGLVLEGTFNTETGVAAVKEDGTAEDLTMTLSDVTATNGEYNTAPVIVFPNESQASIGLKVVVDGNTYEAKLPVDGGKLVAGNHYVYPVRVTKTGLEVGTAQITEWNVVGADKPAIDATMPDTTN